MTSRFGTWTNPRQVGELIRDHAALWAEEFIAEAERQFGIPPRSVPVPQKGQFVFRRSDLQKRAEDQLPAVLVLVPGLIGEPRREADRSLTAPIAVSLAVLTSSGGHPDDAAEESAVVIGTAFKQLFQNLPAVGLAQDAPALLMDERYGDIPFAVQRSLGSARLVYRYWIRNWVVQGSPPSRTAPRPDPYVPAPPLTKVLTVNPTVINRRIGT